jgi:primosomal protein N' (replication factor Y)
VASAPEAPGLFPDAQPAPERPRAAAGYAEVAVNRPMRCEYTYTIPPELADSVVVGARVAVTFAGRREVAVVVGRCDETDVPSGKLRPIRAVLDPEPVIDAPLLALTRWMAAYYACSWGEALAALLPSALKREGGRRKVAVLAPAQGVGAPELASLEERFPKQHRLLRTLLDAGGPIERKDLLRKLNLSDSPVRTLLQKGWVAQSLVEVESDELLTAPPAERARPETLTDGQQRALSALCARLEERRFGAFLLHGVTGSGKTEVYLRVIEEALARGRSAIVLVPEIALTPQTVGWFRSRFDCVAVLHSRMTDTQRLDMWRRVQRGDARVVVGARSAIFAPVRDLGVVVVDEEHEPSFKQGNAPRYHARDVAVMRARDSDAVCVLGSATPSLESWHNARRGRYELLSLPSRVHGGRMPAVQIVDLRQEQGAAPFSRRLRTMLAETLARGEQSILFLNRRGFSPVLWCRACSEVVRCSQCDVALTFHRRLRRVVCHACCEEQAPPTACPSCTAPGLQFLGQGSEQVESALRELLPDARVGRMDSDTMLRREDYEETLDAFGKGALDVLVGTQMIAKGLDFPRVTLVGIIAADSALHLPDFRAAERTFQLISQVAGRAGRGALQGRIVIQTHAPEHPAIVQAARYGYETFAAAEAQLRAELGYPPHGRLVRVVLEDEDEARVSAAAATLGQLLTRHLDEHGVVCLGPTPAPMALLRGRHRHHVLLKAPGEGDGLARARGLLVRFAAEHTRPRISIDVDPLNML